MFGQRLNQTRTRWRTCLAWCFCLSLCLLACSPSLAQSSEFDRYFKQATLDYLYGYLPDGDWRWFKAQCYQESRLKADAVSPAGASGICQIMPAAAQDSRLSWQDRFDAERNIKAGAWILRRNIRTWWPRPTRIDRLRLGWAGYNAGAGHIIRAQLLCGGAKLWEDISPCLHQVTGHHATETQNYVTLVEKWYWRMVDGETL